MFGKSGEGVWNSDGGLPQKGRSIVVGRGGAGYSPANQRRELQIGVAQKKYPRSKDAFLSSIESLCFIAGIGFPLFNS